MDVHVRRLREKLPVLVDAVDTVKQFEYRLADEGTATVGSHNAQRNAS